MVVHAVDGGGDDRLLDCKPGLCVKPRPANAQGTRSREPQRLLASRPAGGWPRSPTAHRRTPCWLDLAGVAVNSTVNGENTIQIWAVDGDCRQRFVFDHTPGQKTTYVHAWKVNDGVPLEGSEGELCCTRWRRRIPEFHVSRNPEGPIAEHPAQQQ